MNVILRDVSFRHSLRGRPALRGASLEVAAGESLGLVGPNGAGKSTLLACLLGFLRPAGGEVSVDGLPADALTVRGRLGWLAERPAFPPLLSARGVLELHHAILGRPRARRDAEVSEILERVGLSGVAGRRPSGFSLGMRQRLGLACALTGDPALLILDEPATGLDPPGTLLLREELRAARARGATIVLSSHQLDEVERACGTIAFMSEGVVGEPRSLRDITAGPRILRVRCLREGRSADAASIRAALAGERIVSASEGEALVEIVREGDAARVAASLAAGGLTLTEIAREGSALETLFAGVRA